MEIKIVTVSTEDRFRLWYREPIQALEGIRSGQAAIVALMVALPLYERYWRFLLANGEPDNRSEWVKADLKLGSTEEAAIFWNVFRDGLCHTGSFFEISEKAAKKEWMLPKIGLDAGYPSLPQFVTTQNGERLIIVNPWGLVWHILKKYENNVKLLEFEQAPLVPLRYVVST